MLDRIYDIILIGAGGLSTGIYLSCFHLSSPIADKGKARSFWMQELHNYLGLPPDTPGRVLWNGFVEEVLDEGGTFAIKVKVGRQKSSR